MSLCIDAVFNLMPRLLICGNVFFNTGIYHLKKFSTLSYVSTNFLQKFQCRVAYKTIVIVIII